MKDKSLYEETILRLETELKVLVHMHTNLINLRTQDIEYLKKKEAQLDLAVEALGRLSKDFVDYELGERTFESSIANEALAKIKSLGEI